jgi:hypothetical protein
VSAVVHIAGMYVRINNLLRQRCAWCGAVLLDVNLENVAVPVGQEVTPDTVVATWPVGELVGVDGNLTYAVTHVDGEPLPDGACGRIDPEVTV